ATRADAGTVRPFMPFTGFTRLSRRGIIIWATTLGRRRTIDGFPHIAWPPQLSSFRVEDSWEGAPSAGHVQQRLRSGHAGGWDLDVRVYFATQHPDKALLALAQAELNRLVLPHPVKARASAAARTVPKPLRVMSAPTGVNAACAKIQRAISTQHSRWRAVC